MKDLLGRELKVGDRVAHVGTSGSSLHAREKTIKEFRGTRIYFEGSTNRSTGWATEGRVIKLEKSNG